MFSTKAIKVTKIKQRYSCHIQFGHNLLFGGLSPIWSGPVQPPDQEIVLDLLVVKCPNGIPVLLIKWDLCFVYRGLYFSEEKAHCIYHRG